jgi:hypothetical protein
MNPCRRGLDASCVPLLQVMSRSARLRWRYLTSPSVIDSIGECKACQMNVSLGRSWGSYGKEPTVLLPGRKRPPCTCLPSQRPPARRAHSAPSLPECLAPDQLGGSLPCVARPPACLRLPGARRVWSGLGQTFVGCAARTRDTFKQHIAVAWGPSPPPDRVAPRATPHTPGLKRAPLKRRPLRRREQSRVAPWWCRCGCDTWHDVRGARRVTLRPAGRTPPRRP